MQKPSDFEIFLSLTQNSSMQFDVFSLDGEEVFCDDYHFQIEALTNISIETCTENVLGGKAIVTRLHADSKTLHHGIITHIISHGIKCDKCHYTLTIRSPLYQLKLSSHLRTYQNKNITEIISDILIHNEWPSYTYRFAFQKIIPTIDYLIQYNKDDFMFIMELLNRFGLCNYFEQQPNYFVWVICDSQSDFSTFSADHLAFHQQTSLNINSVSIHKMNQKSMALPDHYVLNEYNYLTPDTNLNIITQNKTGILASGAISLYDQNYTDIQTGTLIANVLQNHINVKRSQFIAESNYHCLASGQLISINDHPQNCWNCDYQITKISYQIYQPVLHLADNEIKNISFTNTITLTVLTPSIEYLTKESQNKMTANLSGIMLGKIYTDIPNQNAAVDEYGRYKVALLFSSTKESPFNTTLPLRLLQMYGGDPIAKQNYGTHFPLSAGTVVILTFINGDINRPLIMGVLPNSFMPSSVTANNHTQNKITTTSLNEISFEERQGIQHIILQTKDKKNALLLDATDNNHLIMMTSQMGQLQCYAYNDMNITAKLSIYKTSTDCHYATIANQHLLYSQQSIELQAGNNVKLISKQNITIYTLEGTISFNCNAQLIAQCDSIFQLQSQNSNINLQIHQGDFQCYSYKDITIQNQGSGQILLKNGMSEMLFDNSGSVLLQASSIYLNAPKIVLQKNALINNMPI